MTLIWFVVWLVADRIGDWASLTLHPVNIWVGTLLLAIAVDLSRPHAAELRRTDRRRPASGS